jgi:hypothetical protein
LTKLLAVRALFDANDIVTRGEFEAFADTLLRDSSDIVTLSWVPHVRNGERASLELAAARERVSSHGIQTRDADGSLHPAGRHDQYFPILYSTVPRDSPVYGLDLRSQPATLAQLERARDSDQLGFSSVAALVSAAGAQDGFIFSLPVYRQGLPHDTVEDRRRNLAGFVHGSMLTARLIETVIAATTTPQGVDLLLFDPQGGPNRLPLYVHSSRLRALPAQQRPQAELQTASGAACRRRRQFAQTGANRHRHLGSPSRSRARQATAHMSLALPSSLCQHETLALLFNAFGRNYKWGGQRWKRV